MSVDDLTEIILGIFTLEFALLVSDLENSCETCEIGEVPLFHYIFP